MFILCSQWQVFLVKGISRRVRDRLMVHAQCALLGCFAQAIKCRCGGIVEFRGYIGLPGFGEDFEAHSASWNCRISRSVIFGVSLNRPLKRRRLGSLAVFSASRGLGSWDASRILS